MSTPPTPDNADESPLYRDQIRKRLKKQQEFQRFLGVWGGVSVLLIIIWLLGRDNLFLDKNRERERATE